jgi:3-oxoacyl-[acyl-carrier-protein] synthase II
MMIQKQLQTNGRDSDCFREGAGALILKNMNMHCSWSYCEIGGGGVADAYHITAPHPDGLGAKM